MAARQRRGAMALAPAAAPESVPAAARAGLDMARPPHGGARGGGTKHDRPDGPSVHGSRVPEAFPNSKQGTNANDHGVPATHGRSSQCIYSTHGVRGRNDNDSGGATSPNSFTA